MLDSTAVPRLLLIAPDKKGAWGEHLFQKTDVIEGTVCGYTASPYNCTGDEEVEAPGEYGEFESAEVDYIEFTQEELLRFHKIASLRGDSEISTFLERFLDDVNRV